MCIPTLSLSGLLVVFASHLVAPLYAADRNATSAATSRALEQTARAEFRNPDNKVIGETTLLQSNAGVLIVATFTKLPAGRHAFHVHETGSYEAPEFDSASDHFNPQNAQHGLMNPKGPHAGDMPNFTASKSGGTVVEIYSDRVTLRPGADNSLLRQGGTSLVVHAGGDDHKTDPAGVAGERIACGVIEATQSGSTQASK
jgi:Cu-Zn family superoxide dismutase